MADAYWPRREVSRVFGDLGVADVSWSTCLVCLVTEYKVCRWPVCGPFRRCPGCLVIDGRCDLAKVSRVVGDRVRRRGRCVLADVSRVSRGRGVSCGRGVCDRGVS